MRIVIIYRSINNVPAVSSRNKDICTMPTR